jgi:hypothetical protein
MRIMPEGRLTEWFEDRIQGIRRQSPDSAPPGEAARMIAELEGLRDEARRLEGGNGGLTPPAPLSLRAEGGERQAPALRDGEAACLTSAEIDQVLDDNMEE